MVAQDFACGSTWVHHLDPRIKLVVVFLFASILAVGENLIMLGLALLFTGGLTIAAKLKFKKVFSRLLPVNFFLLGVWLFVPASYPGSILAQLGPVTISQAGFMYALQITVRANAVMLGIIALLSTTEISVLVQGMRELYFPQKLVYLIFFLYRYLHVFWGEFKRLRTAMVVRGFESNFSVHCYKSYAYLIGMLIVKSYDRANRVYEAMLCRGFKGDFPEVNKLSLAREDLLFLIGALAFMLWIIVLEKGFWLL